METSESEIREVDSIETLLAVLAWFIGYQRLALSNRLTICAVVLTTVAWNRGDPFGWYYDQWLQENSVVFIKVQ
jgi:hypothetical protein